MKPVILVPALLLALSSSNSFAQLQPPMSRVQRTAPSRTTAQTETPAEESAPTQTQTLRTQQTQPSAERPQVPTQQQRREAAQGPPPVNEAALQAMHFDMTEAAPVQTHHQTVGRALRYTATAGRLPIKDAEGRIEAEMFFVAYTLDSADPATRPLTFAYNGGPGAASIWLHMGALGPKKIVMQPEGWLPAAPYRFADNPNTPLDKTDLVLIDAIGTGYSRPADAAAVRKYENPQGDIEAFSEFIRTYISRYERWSSPLYLFGESYGTTRSAGVAGYLASHGINFNGIVLLSMVLNFETLSFSRTNDVPYPLFLPSYTAIANYHHKLSPELSQNIDRTLEEVSRWAMNDYTLALAKADSMTSQERQNVIDKLAQYTGLSKEIIHQANLRIDVRTFTHYLLADRLLRVGRLDGRYADPDPDGFMETNFTDPTSVETEPPFTMAFYDYVRRELNYKVDMPYYVSGQWSGLFQWNRSVTTTGFGYPGFQDAATPLREAMVKNGYLKVLVMEGNYDLATPFLGAYYTMDHLNLPEKYRNNISYARYESGHMVYLDSKSHAKMKNEFVNFIAATTPK